jgi:hypothetical protein
VKKILACLFLVSGCASDCPTDDCTLKARTVVKWTFNAYPDRGFPMDSCVDFGARKVKVDAVDGAGIVTSLTDDCGVAQVTFVGLTPGDYTLYMMPLDGAGTPLLVAPIVGAASAGDIGDDREVTINVPWDVWTGAYTGTFLFRISWGGLSCEAALPEIKNQVLTLTVNGVVQNITTDDGQALNGTDKKPCKKLTDQFPQSALNATYGPATFLIEGYDATDAMKFSKQFDTFVGAGITNPTLTFDIPMM